MKSAYEVKKSLSLHKGIAWSFVSRASYPSTIAHFTLTIKKCIHQKLHIPLVCMMKRIIYIPWSPRCKCRPRDVQLRVAECGRERGRKKREKKRKGCRPRWIKCAARSMIIRFPLLSSSSSSFTSFNSTSISASSDLFAVSIRLCEKAAIFLCLCTCTVSILVYTVCGAFVINHKPDVLSRGSIYLRRRGHVCTCTCAIHNHARHIDTYITQILVLLYAMAAGFCPDLWSLSFALFRLLSSTRNPPCIAHNNEITTISKRTSHVTLETDFFTPLFLCRCTSAVFSLTNAYVHENEGQKESGLRHIGARLMGSFHYSFLEGGDYLLFIMPLRVTIFLCLRCKSRWAIIGYYGLIER